MSSKSQEAVEPANNFVAVGPSLDEREQIQSELCDRSERLRPAADALYGVFARHKLDSLPVRNFVDSVGPEIRRCKAPNLRLMESGQVVIKGPPVTQAHYRFDRMARVTDADFREVMYRVAELQSTVQVAGDNAAASDGELIVNFQEAAKLARESNRQLYDYSIPAAGNVTAPAKAKGGGKAPAEPVKPDPVSVAVALKKKNPGWSDRTIAKTAGCAPSTLTRDTFYQKVKAAFGADAPPRGTKDGKTGDIEAYGRRPRT